MDKRLSLETRIGVELKSYDGTIKIYILAALFDAIEKGKASLFDMLEYKKEHEIDGCGSMNACRNDGGIISTPYGKYIIVLFNKEFSDAMYYPEHPATVFGSKVSRLIFDQYLAQEGRLAL